MDADICPYYKHQITAVGHREWNYGPCAALHDCTSPNAHHCRLYLGPEYIDQSSPEDSNKIKCSAVQQSCGDTQEAGNAFIVHCISTVICVANNAEMDLGEQ